MPSSVRRALAFARSGPRAGKKKPTPGVVTSSRSSSWKATVLVPRIVVLASPFTTIGCVRSKTSAGRIAVFVEDLDSLAGIVRSHDELFRPPRRLGLYLPELRDLRGHRWRMATERSVTSSRISGGRGSCRSSPFDQSGVLGSWPSQGRSDRAIRLASCSLACSRPGTMGSPAWPCLRRPISWSSQLALGAAIVQRKDRNTDVSTAFGISAHPAYCHCGRIALLADRAVFGALKSSVFMVMSLCSGYVSGCEHRGC